MRRLGMVLGLVGAPALVFVVACSAPPSTSDGVGATVDAGLHVKPGDGDAGGVTAKDAGASDAKVAEDSGVASYDAGGTPGVCPTPYDFNEYFPLPAKPAKHEASACSSAQISGYYASCLGPNATPSTCTTWQQGYGASYCGGCLGSNQYDSSWGALVQMTAGYLSVNVAGCIAVLSGQNPPQSGSCAYAYQSAEACEAASCDSICPVSGDASFQLHEQCIDKASKGACKIYEDAVDQDCQEDGGPYALCFDGPDFETLFLNVAQVLCGK